jgi:adenylate cyclase class IV
VPKYNLNNKAVEPPLVAVRFDNDVFIKGVVNGSIGVVYKGPILANNKRALVDISFTVSEVDPFDASTVFTNGAFRGVVRTLKDGMGLNSK